MGCGMYKEVVGLKKIMQHTETVYNGVNLVYIFSGAFSVTFSALWNNQNLLAIIPNVFSATRLARDNL